jgi:hypothetical protein
MRWRVNAGFDLFRKTRAADVRDRIVEKPEERREQGSDQQ